MAWEDWEDGTETSHSHSLDSCGTYNPNCRKSHQTNRRIRPSVLLYLGTLSHEAASGHSNDDQNVTFSTSWAPQPIDFIICPGPVGQPYSSLALTVSALEQV